MVTAQPIVRLGGEVVKVQRSHFGSGYALFAHTISIRTTDGVRDVHVTSRNPTVDDLPGVGEYCELQYYQVAQTTVGVGLLADRMWCNGRQFSLVIEVRGPFPPEGGSREGHSSTKGARQTSR